jgi:hypothetical protein
MIKRRIFFEIAAGLILLILPLASDRLFNAFVESIAPFGLLAIGSNKTHGATESSS